MKTFFKINPFGRLRINAEQSRSIKIFLLITFLVFTFFSFGIIKAGEEHNVSGWAWSDNIGWISFNNTTDGSSYNYGVNIDLSTGLFSGYAWSDNVGWITFNETELTGCPSGSCRAELNFSTNEVSGWARTVNTGDGWDGWISLRGVAQDLSPYGVFLNSSTNELEYWAWSDDFGWISFNCIEDGEDGTCATSDYKVIYSPSNQPPTCTSLSAVPTQGATPLNVSFTGEGSDSDGAISQYEFDFGNGNSTTVSPGFCTGDIDCDLLGSCLDDCQNCGCSCYLLNCSNCPGPIPCQGPTCSQFTDPTSCGDCPDCSWFDDGKGYVSYSYNSAGTYCAKLRAQDDDGAWSTTPGDCPDICAEQIVVEVNNPPTAAFSCDPDPATCGTSGCTGYTGCLFRLANQSTDPEGAGDIASSTWVITGPTSERIICTLNPLCDWPLQPIHPAGNYTATLTVEDQLGYKDISASQNFTILQDAIADFRCSLDSEGPWSDCDGFGLSEGEVIYFNSEDYSSPSYPGSGTSIISWSWTFVDGTPPASDLQNSSSTFEALSPNSGEISLTITDTAGRSNTTIPPYELMIKPPPPEWKEVPPF